MAVVLVALKSCRLLGIGRSLAGVQALQGIEEQARQLRGHCKIFGHLSAAFKIQTQDRTWGERWGLGEFESGVGRLGCSGSDLEAKSGLLLKGTGVPSAAGCL